ncbi:head decoration protein [Paenibacillus sp. UNC451MF]|uniref:head decoration protein n=1 Tax=Paenibacillus sp. UNC451MF TaxID=1449063 RepID=UPI00048C15AD|nr:head decoration protein [Paenibacillus sp. UNC451MF]
MAEQLIHTYSTNYDNLIAGSAQILTAAVTLKAGRAYLRGSVIALATADSKGSLVDSTKTDGTETPYGILTDNVDATTADAPGIVYLAGEFNGAALVFGGTDKLDKHHQALRNIGITVRKTKKA